MALVTRTGKGSKLTIGEMDGNLLYLEQLTKIIPQSNTVYVNVDISSDLEDNKIFKNYTNAIIWIENNGNPSITNLWQVVLPAGNVGNIVITNPYIRLNCNKNTIIENLISDIEYSVLNSIYSTIYNAQINRITITESNYISIQQCTIVDIAAADGETGYLNASDCGFFGGNFSRIVCPTNFINCKFVGIYGAITHISATFDNCYFSNCEFDVDVSETFGLTNSNFESNCVFINNTDAEVTLQLNACNYGNSITLYNKILLLANFSNLGLIYFSGSNCTATLTDSTVSNFSGSGTIEAYGFSKYCKKVGTITYEDLNSATNIGFESYINFTNAIPQNQYIDSVFFRFTEAFVKPALPPGDINIVAIKQARTEEYIQNQYGTIVCDTYNGMPSHIRDLLIGFEFTSANPETWISGSLDVYANLKSIPTAVYS